MSPLRKLRLIDGPLVDKNRETIGRIAADLVARQATASEAEAIRALFGRYDYGDIALLADDALFEARQRAVARVMVATRIGET
jgi:hypothetical protein